MECVLSDLVLDILSRLPVASVLDCKLVCKRFLDLISHPSHQFAKIHHGRQLLQLASNGDGDASSSSLTGLLFSFEEKKNKSVRPRIQYKPRIHYKPAGIYEPRICYGDEYNNEMNIYQKFSYSTLQNSSFYSLKDRVVGSCNGFICVERQYIENTNIYISNPITMEYVNLPGNASCEENHWHLFGFGYVNEKYKVVKICYPKKSDDFSIREVQVYTIGSGSGWRRTIGVTPRLHKTSLMGIFANGALYWIDDDKKITAFDLADEEFRVIQSPPCLNDDTTSRHCDYMVRALRGNLCVCHQRDKHNLLDIWSLQKNSTGVRWSRDFSIPYDASDGRMYHKFPNATPILITKKNEVLFVHQSSTLYCYDPKANTVIQLWNVNVFWQELRQLTAFPHMNSFASLEALGERSQRKKKFRDRCTIS